MDRRQLIVAAALAACGGAPTAGSGRPLADAGSRSPTGVRIASTAARGVLTYAAIPTGDRLVSVELRLRFELVVRRRRGHRWQQLTRIDLGPPDYDVGDLAIHDDTAWVTSTDGTVRGYRLSATGPPITLRLGQSATAVAVSPAGTLLATGTADGVLCLRRLPDRALLQCVAEHSAAISALAFAPDGASLASVDHAGQLVLWSAPALAIRARHRETGSLQDVAFAPSGDRLALAAAGAPPVHRRVDPSGDPDAAIVIWRLGTPARRCRSHTGAVTAVSWAGDHLLSSSWDRTVAVTRASDCAVLARLGGFTSAIRGLTTDRGRAAVAAWSANLDSRSTVLVDLLYPD